MCGSDKLLWLFYFCCYLKNLLNEYTAFIYIQLIEFSKTSADRRPSTSQETDYQHLFVPIDSHYPPTQGSHLFWLLMTKLSSACFYVLYKWNHTVFLCLVSGFLHSTWKLWNSSTLLHMNSGLFILFAV